MWVNARKTEVLLPLKVTELNDLVDILGYATDDNVEYAEDLLIYVRAVKRVAGV